VNTVLLLERPSDLCPFLLKERVFILKRKKKGEKGEEGGDEDEEKK
jgi:hypothetical protein